MASLKVLLVEDSEDDALLVLRALGKGGFEPEARRVETAEAMARALAGEPWDVILCDFKLPGFGGFDAIALVKEAGLDIPLLIVSGSIGEEVAVECMRRGAHDYILKDHLSRLCPAIERELAESKSRTSRRLAEAALLQSEEKFKTIANYTINWESWFAPDGTYLWVNPAVERITGYPAAEVLAMPDFVQVMIAYEDRPLFKEYFCQALAGTRGENYEVRCLRKNGSVFWLSVSWQPVYDAQNHFLGIRTSGRDISALKQADDERRKLEQQLFKAQKMEAIGTLAAGIAHDFNNILSGIIGYTELIAMQADAAASRNIRQILNAAERARNLIKQILAFSRHVEKDQKPMDVRSVIQEALKLLRATISTTVEIRIELADKPVVINADYTQMHQVLMNICTNAVHAMGEKGGLLSVHLSCEDIQDRAFCRDLNLTPGRYARLAIADTGQGIDPAHVGRLFDPFFTTKKPGEGTGLGLAVVCGIVYDHGGGIGVESLPGCGATFNVYLPVIEDAQEAEAIPESKIIPRGHERVLFVDDEPDLVDLGCRMLSSLGYSVTGCTESPEALKIYAADPGSFDLVITDMNMPSMSGGELALEMLKLRRDQAIILCTGYSDYMNSEKAAAIGIRAFVMKPLTREILAALVRKALNNHIAPVSPD